VPSRFLTFNFIYYIDDSADLDYTTIGIDITYSITMILTVVAFVNSAFISMLSKTFLDATALNALTL